MFKKHKNEKFIIRYSKKTYKSNKHLCNLFASLYKKFIKFLIKIDLEMLVHSKKNA